MTSKIAAGGIGDAARLRSIASSTDANSRRIIEQFAPTQCRRLLDIGAGTGSIAEWMAQQWPASTVVAVDQDTALMSDDTMPTNVTVVETDVRELAGEEGAYDLVHARFVLAHLPDRDQVAGLAAELLAPGGTLIITEPYALDPDSRYPAVSRVMAAYAAYCARNGMDLRWSKTVPGLLQEHGLTVAAVESAAGRLGGGPGRDRWAPLIDRVRTDLIGDGLPAAVLDEFTELCGSAAVYDVPQVVLTTVARRDR